MTRAADALALARHQRLVQGLLHGAAFDVPPAQRRLVQTHISSVVLAGEHAYKLRKPLRLPFLDFSTVALRRTDCEDELRLNQRTAPALYIDVLPLTGTLDAPRLDSRGRTLEWLLRMRRFDEAQQLDRLAGAGRLDAALVDALAQRIGHFHAGLPPSPPAWGTAQTVREWAIDNFDTLAAGLAPPAHAPRLAALRHWTEQAFTRLAPTIAQRHAGGFVREGHGDLHLGNIVVVGGEPLPFDGLEFNPALRHIDIVTDIAFTFMDLQRHGLPALAWRLVSGWAGHTGDHAGLVLLHFFAVYRAVVRAKVALLRAGQGDTGAVASFERDLALAETLAAPRAAAPWLVLTSGLSGSGKTTFAREFAPVLGAVCLRSDVERKRLHGLAAHERPSAGAAARLYSKDATRRTFDHLAALAGTLLQGGLDVVVDAAFQYRAERARFSALAHELGAQHALVECVAPEAVLRERLARRTQEGTDASDADGAVLTRQLREREPITPEEGALVMDTDVTPATLASAAERLAMRWRSA